MKKRNNSFVFFSLRTRSLFSSGFFSASFRVIHHWISKNFLFSLLLLCLSSQFMYFYVSLNILPPAVKKVIESPVDCFSSSEETFSSHSMYNLLSFLPLPLPLLSCISSLLMLFFSFPHTYSSIEREQKRINFNRIKCTKQILHSTVKTRETVKSKNRLSFCLSSSLSILSLYPLLSLSKVKLTPSHPQKKRGDDSTAETKGKEEEARETDNNKTTGLSKKPDDAKKEKETVFPFVFSSLLSLFLV